MTICKKQLKWASLTFLLIMYGARMVKNFKLTLFKAKCWPLLSSKPTMQHIGICFNQINFQIQIFQVNSRQKISYKISTKQIQSINQSTPAKSEGGSDMWSGLRHKWLIQQSPCLRCITRKCEALGKGNKSNEIHRVPCQ